MKEYYSLELVSGDKHLVKRNGKYGFEEFIDRPRIQNYSDVNLLHVNPIGLEIPEIKDGFELVMYKKRTNNYGELTHTSILDTHSLVSVSDSLFAFAPSSASVLITEKENYRDAINLMTLRINNLIAIEQNRLIRNKTNSLVTEDYDSIIGELEQILPKKLNPELILK